MQHKFTYIFLLILILSSSFVVVKNSEVALSFTLETTQTAFEAGTTIVLKVATTKEIKPLLYCSNSYGSTLLTPIYENKILSYTFPSNISSKIGVIKWELIHEESSISGEFNIHPKQVVSSMETYIGPPSIEAGGMDYSMLVVIPTDSLDNPLAENTLVKTKYQFLNLEKQDDIYTKNFIAYKNIYSQNKSGRILVSSEALHTNSKEFSITVFPAIPIDFKILASRSHAYADGNQVTTFSTSVLTDVQNNIISDGTFVSFFITNDKGSILNTSGTTINGVATSKMIHPDYGTQWTVKAYVEGIAESNTITLNYSQVVKDFKVEFSETNRGISVGPLQSFMNQMIPDGLEVKLFVYKNNRVLETMTKTSFNGFVDFYLKPDVFKNDTYSIVLKTAGLKKTFNSKILW